MKSDFITYGDFLNKWLNVYKKPYIKTWKRIQNTIRLHIPDYIKRTRVRDLCVLDIQSALNNVSSSRMRLEVYDVYHGSLSMAYNLELLPRDISRFLVKPKHVREVGTSLTVDELSSLLNFFTGTGLFRFYYFLVHTGVRRSEALNLKWSDIDFLKGYIHIRGTKTTCSDRYIPIFDNVREILLIQRKFIKSQNIVFPYSPGYVTRRFSQVCPNHKLHDLRHTFATRCLECGISMKVVQSWLGHSRLDTTAMIYSHVLPHFDMSEAKKFKLF